MKKINRSDIRNFIKRCLLYAIPKKQANLLQCSREGLWDEYFIHAELSITQQWDKIIQPLIKDFDFDITLELAPGVGRNTKKLCSIARVIYAVDYSESILSRCRERLGSLYQGCKIIYKKNNGRDLRMIKNNTCTAIYCWDSAVHFDSSILAGYIAEFARVLKKGGKGFVHHSNLGDKANKILEYNPGWRSNMSKELFFEFCKKNGLRVLIQKDIPWVETIDCVTIFMKPLSF